MIVNFGPDRLVYLSFSFHSVKEGTQLMLLFSCLPELLYETIPVKSLYRKNAVPAQFPASLLL